jgi:prophage regulatory protein
MEKMMFKVQEVVEICGISRATIYRQVNAGKFPSPIAVSDNGKRWRKTDIERWCVSPENWSSMKSTSAPTDQKHASSP